jgi:hypothetical protein
MIQTDAGLRATREALAKLEEAMLDLNRNRAKYHPGTFALLAAPIADEIHARRAEIDEYIGVPAQDAPSTNAVLPPSGAPDEVEPTRAQR